MKTILIWENANYWTLDYKMGEKRSIKIYETLDSEIFNIINTKTSIHTVKINSYACPCVGDHGKLTHGRCDFSFPTLS